MTATVAMVRLPKSEKQKVADRVLGLLRIPSDAQAFVWYEPYTNGREQGWAVYVGNGLGSVACFSEFRNSDDIVMYLGEKDERFERNTNTPTDRAYNAKRFVGYGQYAKAAAILQAWIDATLSR